MRIMDRPGFQVRHPIMEDLKAVTDLIVACDIEEAFRDHWEYTPADLAAWSRRRFDYQSFDPTLYFLALQGDKIAGGALCRHKQAGWVTQLAVRPPWRRIGLGLARLRHSFAESFRRGTRTVGLSVDAGNPTGATRLYEKAGMRVAEEYQTTRLPDYLTIRLNLRTAMGYTPAHSSGGTWGNDRARRGRKAVAGGCRPAPLNPCQSGGGRSGLRR